MVAAPGALGKSAAGDVDIEAASADLAGKESHDRHAPPKAPAEGREQLRFGALEGGGDDFRRSQRFSRRRHEQTLMRLAKAVNANQRSFTYSCSGMPKKSPTLPEAR